jgi:predicted transcriptional regulator
VIESAVEASLVAIPVQAGLPVNLSADRNAAETAGGATPMTGGRNEERGMRGLGELESAVMDVMWVVNGPLRVRDVLDELAPGRPLAYTTVMTVLDNLHRKGWVLREMEGRAYRYRPAASRQEVTARALRSLLDSSGDAEAALLHFVRSASDREFSVLRDAVEIRGSTAPEDGGAAGAAEGEVP